MSTTEYLKDLDLDQLRFAKEVAERLIKDFEDQDQIKLWVVAGTSLNESCFCEDDFQKAKERVCELIMRDDFTQRDVLYDHPKIHRQVAYESEVAGWMRLND